MKSRPSKDQIYRRNINALSTRFQDGLDLPRVISIETQVRCNAKCSFCPYPTSPRKGEEMESDLFYKIIDDLAELPPEHVFHFTLARINEPLLDERLQDFSDYVAKHLPGARQSFWSNGTMLNPGGFEWMETYEGSSLNISLNSVNEADHLALMGFGLTKVLRNLDYLHGLKEAGDLEAEVTLHAPFQSQEKSREIQTFCAKRFPLFKLGIRPFFVWEGDEKTGAREREQTGVVDGQGFDVTALACGQWFDLHILANGFATKCCIDQTGFSTDKYDARQHHALDIYRQSQSLRRSLPGRGSVSGCESCAHLG